MAICQTFIDLSQKTLWEQAISGIPHPPAHRYSYCSALARSSAWQPSLFVAYDGSERMVCPMCIRKKEKGRPEVVSPYGFGGVSINCPADSGSRYAAAWDQFARDNKFITAYILQHPCFSLQAADWNGDLHPHRSVYVLDLSADLETLWRGMSKGHRYEIRRAENRSDVQLESRRSNLADALIDLYPRTLARVTASPVYHFTRETIETLAYGADSLLLGARQGGQIEAVVMFVYTPWVADYFINASTPAGKGFTRMLVWHGICALRELGVPRLNLGGGIKPGDSLDGFKRRFGARTVMAYALRQVFDRREYERLCHFHEVAGNASLDGYFPPYWTPA